MSDAVIKELTDHEGRISRLEKGFEKIDLILTAVTRLEQQMIDRHTPETCPRKMIVEDHETRLRRLEELRSAAVGGGRVIYWLIGASAAGLAMFIGWLLGVTK